MAWASTSMRHGERESASAACSNACRPLAVRLISPPVPGPEPDWWRFCLGTSCNQIRTPNQPRSRRVKQLKRTACFRSMRFSSVPDAYQKLTRRTPETISLVGGGEGHGVMTGERHGCPDDSVGVQYPDPTLSLAPSTKRPVGA